MTYPVVDGSIVITGTAGAHRLHEGIVRGEPADGVVVH
jgi:hypothetical protein